MREGNGMQDHQPPPLPPHDPPPYRSRLHRPVNPWMIIGWIVLATMAAPVVLFLTCCGAWLDGASSASSHQRSAQRLPPRVRGVDGYSRRDIDWYVSAREARVFEGAAGREEARSIESLQRRGWIVINNPGLHPSPGMTTMPILAKGPTLLPGSDYYEITFGTGMRYDSDMRATNQFSFVIFGRDGRIIATGPAERNYMRRGENPMTQTFHLSQEERNNLSHGALLWR